MNSSTSSSLDLISEYDKALSPHVSSSEPYALLDFPDHYNVGDSAIYAGEMAYFDSKVGYSPAYVCTFSSYRRDVEDFAPEGPIFLHGGGNFGDVWPAHQDFRHEVLERYTGRKVVQLPQSIHFRDQKAVDKTAKAISGHGNFTLLVRDRESFDFASKAFDCEVVMCPDAAHNISNLSKGAAKAPVLSMIRKDREQRGDSVVPFLESLGEVKDWERQFWARSPMDRIVERVISPRIRQTGRLMARREKMFRRQAWNRVNYGVRLLSEGELVISDRLHVHIMSSLMNKKHISLDNYYGKIERYIAAWGNDGLVTQVSDLSSLKKAVTEAGYG
ncbi:pyruvyl transferase EpsO [Cognatiyoonia sediminum]|uniref:Pyruvyl transferase EpsO n=1 Tax=Cognatiyoonia sediminum TaxID=1508389 RepID=A0A1M5QYF0_9RHOB|nr:polysaccharide pyruvyl transferase family protein [Cognatiyoonia sediminum]SHH18563.1 pyruvyl transferase EpsO [Cognatiyoonia sediminum]